MNTKSASTQTHFDILDIMKWLCAWMVVIIHTIPLKPYSLIADVYTAQGICRLAVPLFFAASSFLLLRKLPTENKQTNKSSSDIP